MDSLDWLFLVLVMAHLYVSPFTKVEESFNLHAIHDMLFHGSDIDSYDHREFPGVVPRTFLGALVVAAITKPLQLLVPLRSKFDLQLIARGVLGLINWYSVVYFRGCIRRVFGKTTAFWFATFQYSQFHITYYASRTLPNMFAFPLTMVAAGYWITNRPRRTIAVMAFTTVVFRSELLLLIAPLALSALVQRRISVYHLVLAGIEGGLLGMTLSIATDTVFWKFPILPEAYGFYFNAVLGKAVAWGTQPWYAYFCNHVPKLLLNPAAVPLFAVGLFFEARRIGMTVGPYLVFIALYSAQPHKEWRFIVYAVPVLTLTVALGASWISNRMRKGYVYLGTTLMLVISVAATLMLAVGMLAISSANYPGGHAVMAMHGGLEQSGLGNLTVHLDIPTCMSGATLFTFTREDIEYDRTEDEYELRDVAPDVSVMVTFDKQFPEPYPAFGTAREWAFKGSVKAFAAMQAPWVALGPRFWETEEWWKQVVLVQDRVWIYVRRSVFES
ncbi:Alg9-like mannosyltransferase family-domain-containing protein [Myxozyma melibiosi]|uniref:Mannosyltransferase n=1 Tax=Myxozyma melibiosi TaxID=54550 RepID=A0ABR1F9Q5_9ASCO